MKYYYDNKRTKKLYIRNRVLAILLAAGIGIGCYALKKGNDAVPEPQINNNYIENVLDNIDPNHEARNGQSVTPQPTAIPTAVPTVAPTAIPTQAPVYVETNGGDTVYATTDVNMRLSADKNSYKMGVLGEGSIVDRLYSDGDWDLIRTGDTIAYVHGDYTREYDTDFNNEYYDIEDYRDIVRTTSKLYFRVGPDQKERDLFLLDKDEELVVIGRAIKRDNPSDVWYLVKARGKIGFVSASYTKSYRSAIQSIDPNLQDIEIEKVARVKRDTTLVDQNKNYVASVGEYQLVNIIEQYNNYSLVEIDGRVGLIPNKDIAVVKGRIFVCDISTQRVYYYYNGEVAYRGRCTTGKDKTPTLEGYYPDYEYQYDYHDFGHDDYEAKVLFWKLGHNQFFHDADWEEDCYFGDTDYYHRHGSGGCPRLGQAEAHYVQDNVPDDTPRLIHQ